MLPGFVSPTLGPSWPQVTTPAPGTGRSGHLVCRVGGLKELRRLPGLQGDWGHQQGKRQPLHSHGSRPGLTFRPQPRHGACALRGEEAGIPCLGSPIPAQAAFSPGSHWSGLLAGLHAGPHAWRLPASGDGTLAGFALCCLRPVVYFLLPAGDAACGEAGKVGPRTCCRAPGQGLSSVGTWGWPRMLGWPLLLHRGSWGHSASGDPCLLGRASGPEARPGSGHGPPQLPGRPLQSHPLPRHPLSARGSRPRQTCSAPWPCSVSRPWPVARTHPLETVRRHPHHECRTVASSGCWPLQTLSVLPRDPSPSPPGSGVLPLPLPVLGSRVHPELPRSSALPVQQVAAPACLPRFSDAHPGPSLGQALAEAQEKLWAPRLRRGWREQGGQTKALTAPPLPACSKERCFSSSASPWPPCRAPTPGRSALAARLPR